ncbi:DNA recombination protein RmuC [bacterium]|nr:DNA recombination protein RmuC [bacterium]
MNDILLIFTILIIVGIGVGIIVVLLNRKLRVDQSQNQEITRLKEELKELIKDIGGRVDGTSRAMYQQISSFTRETVQIREKLKEVGEAMKSISSFQEFFKSPKIRGQWGEASLEHILSEYFPKELYKIQYLFSSGEQVDAVLKLPNGKLLPIDAKFPFDNFRKMIETELGEEKDFFKKKFIEDVKQRIQEIASKYILPSENTVDFAIMYIPAEAVFYEINMSRDVDLADYARSKKVILTSPNTIYLTLRTIEHWFKDTQISKRTQEILKRLSKIQQDSKKLAEDFRRLGVHLRNAASAYDNSEKRLSLFSERVERLLEIPAQEDTSLRDTNDKTQQLKEG